MAQISIGPMTYEWRFGQRNDTRGPISAEARQNPYPQYLQCAEHCEPRPVEFGRTRQKYEEANEPRRVQKDDDGIMPAAELARAACQKRARVARRIGHFDGSLQR